MDGISIENKARIFDWIWKNFSGTIMDAIMDFMYVDSRELHDMIYPPDDE